MKFNNETLRAAVKEWLDDEVKQKRNTVTSLIGTPLK